MTFRGCSTQDSICLEVKRATQYNGTHKKCVRFFSNSWVWKLVSAFYGIHKKHYSTIFGLCPSLRRRYYVPIVSIIIRFYFLMVYGRLKLLYSQFYYATHCKRKKYNVCINQGFEFTCYLNCYHREKRLIDLVLVILSVCTENYNHEISFILK